MAAHPIKINRKSAKEGICIQWIETHWQMLFIIGIVVDEILLCSTAARRQGEEMHNTKGETKCE